jgi:pimeloyl-ACP methyl ester carboxylesterase
MLSRGAVLRRLPWLVPALLLAGCSATVSGAPQAASPSTGAAVVLPSGGQITVPSGGTRSTTSAPASTTGAGASSGGAPGTGGAEPAIPAGLQRFYDQKLQWGACTDYSTNPADAAPLANPAVSCARLTLPLSYADPSGPTISTGVIRQQATGSDRIGSLLFNPGGPGDPGIPFVASVISIGSGTDSRASAIQALAARFDLVGFDPRGTGSSRPAILCRTDAEWDAERTQDQRSATAAQVAAANKILQTDAQRCAARSGADGIDGKTFLANVGTVDSARDMDVLRAVLGDKKLNYVGYSYGTLLGSEYARQFPHNIRAMILDGAVDPGKDAAETGLAQTAAFQQAFTTFAQWCATQSNCPLGSDPAAATERYQQLVRPLLTTPLQLSDGRTLSFTDATVGTSQAMYSDSLWPSLAAALADLAAGQGDSLMSLADSYDGRESDGRYSTLLDSFNAIRCMDSPAMTDDAQVTAYNAQVIAAAPFSATGDPAGAIKDICAFWPVPPTRKVQKLDLTDLSAKPLVISTTGDPATPYQDGVSLAQQLHASLLTINGTRHTGYLLTGIACADQVGNAYLLNLTAPADGASCS